MIYPESCSYYEIPRDLVASGATLNIFKHENTPSGSALVATGLAYTRAPIAAALGLENTSALKLKMETCVAEPRYTVSGSSVYVACGPQRDGSDYDIFFAKSASGGTNFGGIAKLSSNGGDSLNPDVGL